MRPANRNPFLPSTFIRATRLTLWLAVTLLSACSANKSVAPVYRHAAQPGSRGEHPTEARSVHLPVPRPPELAAPPPRPTQVPPTQSLPIQTTQIASGSMAHAARRRAVTTPAAPSTPDNAYALGNDLETWKSSLKTGHVIYSVPPTMFAQQASAVRVEVHGFSDQGQTEIAAPTGNGTAKVSSYMKAELLAPSHPGEFAIVQQNSTPIQFVPNDGFAAWMWSVTPTDRAGSEELLIRISLVYTAGGGPPTDSSPTQILVDKTYPVRVNVVPLHTTISHAFWHNPLAWFQYMLPGGAGWATLAGIFIFLGGGAWVKRKFFSGKKPGAT